MVHAALTRRLVTTLVPLFVLLLTACGGGGGAGNALPATKTPATPMPLSIISNSNGVIDLTGNIVAMITGGFQVQGGQGVGYLHIYTNSSTVINGPAPYVGENVEVVGTGTLSSGNITATSVTQLGASPSPSPTPTATPTPVPLGSPIPLPSGVYAQTGQVASVSSTRLTINAGSGCGSMYVYLNSSTTYFDGTPAVGEYGSFTGTGTRCSAITAATVSLSSSAFTSANFTGIVAAQTGYGFTLNTGSGSPIPVALSSSTVVFGGTLAVGANVTVTALGTAATGLTATQVAVAAPTPAPVASPTATPGPISMTHVPVFAYIYGYAGTPTTIPIGSMAPYVNWTQTDPGDAAAIRAAGIKVQVYTNYWRNYTSDNPNIGYTDLAPGGTNAAAEAKDCSGNAIYDSNYGGGYEADARSANALAHAQTVATYRLNEYAGNYDTLFADDTGSVWGITLPCGYDQASYDSAVNSIHSQMGVQMFVNALGAAPNPATAIDLAQPSNVLGAMCEICYGGNGSAGDYVQTGTAWQNVESAEIGMVQQHKIFWDYARLTGSAASETAMRTYVYASFLLSYDPSYGMFQEALSTPSGFPVMPETGLVATSPLTTASSIAGYQAAGGAYMREFGACYYRGNFVNRCAVVVNSSASSVPVPTTSYTHTMVLSGSGVLDGGTASFDGPQVTTLAPGTAAILFP